MRIAFDRFSGRQPRIDDRMLPPEAATEAHDLRLTSGAIRPMRSTVLRHTVPGGPHEAIFVFPDNETFVGSADDRDSAVPSPNDGDALYIARPGSVTVKLQNGVETRLGVPSPSQRPNAQVVGDAQDDITEGTVFAVTYVNADGEEGPPSRLSNLVRLTPNQIPRVSNLSDVPPPEYRITHKRIYRAQSGESGTTSLFFVDEIPVEQSEYDHNIKRNPLNEPLTSLEYDLPLDRLRGLISLPGGGIAGYSFRRVCFSEPHQPHAWPVAYRLRTETLIQGIVSFGAHIAVLTEGAPYLIQGYEPGAMAMTKSERILPCLSARGIVDIGYACAYPSSEGLVVLGADGAQVVSRPLFSAEQWRSLNPKSFDAAYHDGRYVFWHTPIGGQRMVGIIDLRGEAPFFQTATAVPGERPIMVSPKTAELFTLRNGNELHSFDADTGGARTYRWTSGTLITPSPQMFAAARIDGRPFEGAANVSASLFADGVRIATISGLDTIHRIPPVRAREWRVMIEGRAEVTRLVVASTVAEVAAA